MAISPFDEIGRALARQTSRRRVLTRLGASGLVASVSLAGLARGARAQAGTPVPGQQTVVPPGLPPFVYRLEQSEPQRYAGGTIRTATVANIPAVCYIPVNWFHFANVTAEPLDFLVFFSDPRPNHFDLSQLPAAFPAEILAASFGLDPTVIARLPKRGDVFIANAQITGQATPAP